MRLSIYTFVQNGLYLDFHIVDMLKHHLSLADEIVVNEGYSSDGTYEAIKNIDDKIRIVRSQWDRSNPKTWSVKFKHAARRHCNGDWCIMLDADEFIPEWEFSRLRNVLSDTDKTIFPLRYINFYGNYKVFNTKPGKFGWPEVKYAVHRNSADIEGWGDGSNVRHRSYREYSNPDIYGEPLLDVHHFGMVRHAARLRQKWRTQAMRNRHGSDKAAKWDYVPGIVFDLLPHKWDDEQFLDDLMVYDGQVIDAVRRNPDEFVRDGFATCEIVRQRGVRPT